MTERVEALRRLREGWDPPSEARFLFVVGSGADVGYGGDRAVGEFAYGGEAIVAAIEVGRGWSGPSCRSYACAVESDCRTFLESFCRGSISKRSFQLFLRSSGALLEGGSQGRWRGVEIHDWQTKLEVRRDLRKEATQMPGTGKVQAD